MTFASEHARRAIIVVALLTCLPHVARAQADAPARAQAQDDARTRAAAHFKRGLERAKGGAYAEALVEFETAYGLVQHAATLYNIALAQIALGRTAAATASLRRYLAAPSSTQNPAQRQAAEARLKELLAKQAPLPAAAQAASSSDAPAQLTIVIFPYGEVWIDGEPAGASPLTKTLPAGPHRISGGRDGQEVTAEVVLTPGATQRVVLPWARADLVRAEDQSRASEPR